MSDAWVSPTAGKRGGQLKLNPRRLATFVGYIANGMTPSTAGRATGISDSTRKHWTRTGLAELVRLQDAGTDPATIIDPTEDGWPSTETWTTVPEPFDPDAWPYVVFAVATEKAMASFEARHLGNIQRAASDGAWQASAWLLERLFPGTYSRPEVRVQVEAKATAESKAEVKVVSADEVEQEFLALEEAQRARGQK